jgi:DNA-nicking Smr family endonuclease
MTGSRGRRRRGLSTDERALWKAVTRSVRPLRPLPAADPADAGEVAVVMPAAPVAEPLPAPVHPSPAAGPGMPPLAPLERRMRQRLARGTHELDARLDLHGMTQAHAHGALLHFLRSAQAGGARIVLVITGKGARGADAGGERGVLRRQVPLWLRLPEFRAYVVGFETATATHGGDGALYVRLRRKR